MPVAERTTGKGLRECRTGTAAAPAARPCSTNSAIKSLSWVPRSAASDLSCRNVSSGRSIVVLMVMFLQDRIAASMQALGPRPSPGATFIPWDRARPRAHPSCPPSPRSGRGRPRSQTRRSPLPDRFNPRSRAQCTPSRSQDDVLALLSAIRRLGCSHPRQNCLLGREKSAPPSPLVVHSNSKTAFSRQKRIPSREKPHSGAQPHAFPARKGMVQLGKHVFVGRRSVFPDGKPTSDVQDHVFGRGEVRWTPFLGPPAK